MRLRLTLLQEAAATRPSGYLEDVLSRGQVQGEWLEISSDALAELRAIYRPSVSPASPPVSPPSIPRKRLGDMVASIATPIARVLHLACIDPATRDLRPDSPCARRKAAMNRWL